MCCNNCNNSDNWNNCNNWSNWNNRNNCGRGFPQPGPMRLDGPFGPDDSWRPCEFDRSCGSFRPWKPCGRI